MNLSSFYMNNKGLFSISNFEKEYLFLVKPEKTIKDEKLLMDKRISTVSRKNFSKLIVSQPGKILIRSSNKYKTYQNKDKDNAFYIGYTKDGLILLPFKEGSKSKIKKINAILNQNKLIYERLFKSLSIKTFCLLLSFTEMKGKLNIEMLDAIDLLTGDSIELSILKFLFDKISMEMG